mmetsp:Transcript_8988/g.19273  ORF Transcript_8988/g.19273 Transcript_8988/m.19273 type:complete len:101 (+) Transcript_8988:2124-2426(+)
MIGSKSIHHCSIHGECGRESLFRGIAFVLKHRLYARLHVVIVRDESNGRFASGKIYLIFFPKERQGNIIMNIVDYGTTNEKYTKLDFATTHLYQTKREMV